MVDEKTGDGLITAVNEKQTSVVHFDFSFLRDERYLNSSKREEIDKLNLRELFKSEAEKAAQDLEIKQPLEIVVEIPSDSGEELNYVIESLGIGARTLPENKVLFQLDPANLHLVESLNKWQRRQIAHELNHVARGISDQTLLDALVFEGLATVYEENWGGEYLETPWGNTLKGESLKEEWQRIQKGLNLPFSNYQDWFYGENPDKPMWPGYALGKAIVKAYIGLHPDIPMKELVRKPSREILEQSKFA